MNIKHLMSVRDTSSEALQTLLEMTPPALRQSVRRSV